MASNLVDGIVRGEKAQYGPRSPPGLQAGHRRRAGVPGCQWCAVRKIIVLKIGYGSHAINAWFGAADALMPRSLSSRALAEPSAVKHGQHDNSCDKDKLDDEGDFHFSNLLKTLLQPVDLRSKARGGAVKPCFLAKPDGSAELPPLPGVIPAHISKGLASQA